MTAKALPVVADSAAPARAAVGFEEKLAAHGARLRRAAIIDTLQVNVGKLCNQACKHCHVDASPRRTEVMTPETAEQVVEAVRRWRIPTLDITGGAPELR